MNQSNIIFNYDYVMGENEKKGQQRKENVLRSNLEPHIKKGKIAEVKNALGRCDGDLKNISVDDMKFLLATFMGYSTASPENIDRILMHWSEPPKTVGWPSIDKLNCLYNYFSTDVPLYLDVNSFLKSMLLSIHLLFPSENLKLCLAVMVDRFKIGYAWTAQEIIDSCRGFADANRFNKEKIEACLESYSKVDRTTRSSKVAYTLFKKTEEGKYVLKLTELITYYNNFFKDIST